MIAKNVKGFVLATMCTIMPFITDSTVAKVVIAWKVAEILDIWSLNE